ncbi:MAG TPA: CPBP family intramembrane glutamic endopeptidase [Anaerolineales bacterium]
MRHLLGERLHLDWKIATISVVSTLLLMVDYYHRLTSAKWLDRTILYLVVPLLIILIAFRESPAQYGFTLGDWKAGLSITLIAIAVIGPILWFVARGDAMQAYYEKQVSGLPWNTFQDLLGWEFFFRGWILFGYARKFGPEALWLQAVPFALAHVGKPEIETLSTIFGGFVFGWVAYRTRSFLYPFLIHWFVASFTILVAAGRIG